MNFPSPKDLRISRVLQANLNEKESIADKTRDDNCPFNAKSLYRNDSVSVMTVSTAKIKEKAVAHFVSSGQNISESEINKTGNHNEVQTVHGNQITFDVIESIESQCNANETMNARESKYSLCKSFSQNSIICSPSPKNKIHRRYKTACGNMRSERRNFHEEKVMYTSRCKSWKSFKLGNDLVLVRKVAKKDNGKLISLKNLTTFSSYSIIDHCRSSRMSITKRSIPLQLSQEIKNEIEKRTQCTNNNIVPSIFNSDKNVPSIAGNKTLARYGRPPCDSGNILGKYSHIFADSQKPTAKSHHASNRHYDKHLADTEGDITNLKNRTASNSGNCSGYQSGHTSFWNNRNVNNSTDLNVISIIQQYTSNNENVTDSINENK